MKKIITILIVVFGLSTVSQAQYEDLRNVLKVGAHYQIFSIDGKRTEAAAWGLSYEHSTGYMTSWFIELNFIERTETPEEIYNNVRQYNDLFQVKPGFRKYFDQALRGTYAGGAIALAFPKENGASWEIDGLFGYQYRHKRVSIDAGVELGFGSMRYQEDQYFNGVLVSQEKFYGYGFLIRPMLKMGMAF